jgi:hypothetical protein
MPPSYRCLILRGMLIVVFLKINFMGDVKNLVSKKLLKR